MIGREKPRRLTMRAIAPKTSRVLVVLAVAATSLALGGSAASAATVSINLCAVPGTATLTGADTVPIWGFGIPTTPGDCSTATASLPGPLLSVTLSATETTTVTFAITNALPAGHTVTFEIPGIVFDPGPTDIAPGATASRSFTAPISPAATGATNGAGTYLYQSGGDGGRQEAMGLYGGLVVRPSTANRAYESAATAYDVEAPLVLSAVDPAFNNAADPMAFDMYTYRATFWLINGKAFPSTAPGITAGAGQRVLLRYINAGFDNTAMALLGGHERVLARDARLLNNPFDANAETIPAGATEDAIFTVPAGSPPSVNGFPLYNRQLHLTNGPQSGPSPTPTTGGGMLTFIHS
jgi:FtsP/CotA-like multicopper oxidase with cupredoxin domain